MIAGLDQACNLILKRYLSEFGYKKKECGEMSSTGLFG
jgi:hypothetical protein